MHHQSSSDIINIFNSVFKGYNTRLIKGSGEPVYIPANSETEYHRIEFAHGFFASALHEIAHWCIAGEKRRLEIDYGYWYCPDGRDAGQQAEFEKVEVKPQAIEWFFSVACGLPFKVSTDNLNGAPVDRFAFQDTVLAQVQNYLDSKLPARAQKLVDALRKHYDTPEIEMSHFAPERPLDYAV